MTSGSPCAAVVAAWVPVFGRLMLATKPAMSGGRIRSVIGGGRVIGGLRWADDPPQAHHRRRCYRRQRHSEPIDGEYRRIVAGLLAATATTVRLSMTEASGCSKVEDQVAGGLGTADQRAAWRGIIDRVWGVADRTRHQA